MSPKTKRNHGKVFCVLGWFILLFGVVSNEWVLAALFSADGALSTSHRVKILLFDAGCIVSGVAVINRGPDILLALRRVVSRLVRTRLVFCTGISIVLPFLLLELILRATGHYDTYTERIGLRYASPYEQINRTPWILDNGVLKTYTYGRKEFDFEVRTNREGVRDTQHPVEKPEGEFRIVGLGDSFTEGVGAAFEDSYLRALDRRLKSRCGVDRIRVISGGVSGSDPVFAYHLFLKRLMKYEPDLVILMFNESDISDIMMRGGMGRFDAHGMMGRTQAPAFEWFFAHSHLVRAVLMTFGGYDFFLLRPQERLARQKQAVPVILEVAEALQALGDRYGFDCVLLAQPFTWRALDREIPQLSRFQRDRLAEKGIPYADLTEPFLAALERAGTTAYSWPIDGHYNAKGYEVLAEVVEQALRTRFSSSRYPWCQGHLEPSGDQAMTTQVSPEDEGTDLDNASHSEPRSPAGLRPGTHGLAPEPGQTGRRAVETDMTRP